MSKLFDLVIKNARVVRPNKTSVDCLDIGIKGGKISRLAPELEAGEAEQVFDGKNQLAFPGCVDAHMHVGIYSPLAEDAISESKAAAMGGVTSSLNYIRTGHYYLNRGGPYREFMPEVFKQSKDGSGSTTATTSRRSRPRISTRWSISFSITASRPSRSSCSMAAMACMDLRRSKTNF